MELSQLPHYSGTEKRILFVNGVHSFYGADLVQNDPWLRGGVIRMYSHGAMSDQKMMSEYCPNLRQVFADRYGTVWSERAESSHTQDSSTAGTAECDWNIKTNSEK
jgi:hypothetical protein